MVPYRGPNSYHTFFAYFSFNFILTINKCRNPNTSIVTNTVHLCDEDPYSCIAPFDCPFHRPSPQARAGQRRGTMEVDRRFRILSGAHLINAFTSAPFPHLACLPELDPSKGIRGGKAARVFFVHMPCFFCWPLKPVPHPLCPLARKHPGGCLGLLHVTEGM